jgi:Domain of unknown function (DUF4214)
MIMRSSANHVVWQAVSTGCAVLAMTLVTSRAADAGLVLTRKDSTTGIRGSFTNERATVNFRSRRTADRVVATVTRADGTIIMAVRGDRRAMPRVAYAGILASDHGPFSEHEQSRLSALRVSPEALALGEMLRGLPSGPARADDPWAALHELYHFLTFIGGPGPDGLYEWAEQAVDDAPHADGVAVDAARLLHPVLRDIDDDPGDGGGGGGGTPPPNGPYPGTAWMCAGDADQCIGMAGPGCWGTYVFGTRLRKWSCEALRHDIDYRQRDCLVEGYSSTGGCCGTLEAAVNALLTQPDIGRDGLGSCTLNANCPNPTSCCATAGWAPNGCNYQGGVCREIQYCDPNGNAGSTAIWPCANEATAGAKYLITRYTPDYANGNLLSADAMQVTFTEPGRIVMGISCKASGYGILRVGDDSALCQVYGKCNVRDLNTIDEATLNAIQSNYPAQLPFFHICQAHGFGWYETPYIPAGTWLAFAKSDSGFHGFFDGHGTADTFAYVGNGGRPQVTWAGYQCTLNVDINDPRFFVRQQYRDFLGREPDPATPFGGARDFGGGDWQKLIDSMATHSRNEIGWNFMQSTEFVAAHPALNPANIGTPSFNAEFIRQCYLVFLRREPDADGYNFWLNQVNTYSNYIPLVGGFLDSTEYQHRAVCGFSSGYCG